MVEARQARLRTLLRDQAVAVAVATNDPKNLDKVLPPAAPARRESPAAEAMANTEEKWW